MLLWEKYMHFNRVSFPTLGGRVPLNHDWLTSFEVYKCSSEVSALMDAGKTPMRGFPLSRVFGNNARTWRIPLAPSVHNTPNQPQGSDNGVAPPANDHDAPEPLL
jgi:hypothetical protein